MARAGWLAIVLAAALPATALAALRLDIDTSRLDEAEVLATRMLADRALALLPPAFHAGERVVELRWRDDLPEGVHGRMRAGRIGLQRPLLARWMRRDVGRGDADPDARAVLSALLHEIAHVHDRSPGGGVSSDPRWLDLAGWPTRPLRFGRRTARNDLRDRSPDAYELASPRESFAVNFEHFVLDPDYACRRPAQHRYLERRLGRPPAPPRSPACAPGLPFVVAGARDAALQLLELDPARVQGVDYLLAEANAQPMSRWGHGMLRLVVCAPGRPRGADCRFDLDHHLVLSFRAFVDDVQISSWRGLTGSYPSRLFVLPLQQVVDEYTRVELRGLQSVPLRLDEGEIAALVERAARVHWSLDGRYYFLTNNCAVETWTLLDAGVQRLSGLPLRSITPTGLLRRLEREGVADASVLDDHAAAARAGYRFESLQAHFDDMFAVADAALALPVADVQSWLAIDPSRRSGVLGEGDLRATAALLVLEQAALLREQAHARDTLKRQLLREAGGTQEAAVQLREWLADGAAAGRPSLLLPGGGYGLPLAEERERLRAAVEQDDARLRAVRDGLHRGAREALPAAQRARLEGTESNLAALGGRLRTLRDAQ